MLCVLQQEAVGCPGLWEQCEGLSRAVCSSGVLQCEGGQGRRGERRKPWGK